MKKFLGFSFAVAMVVLFNSSIAKAYNDNYFSSGTVILYESKLEIIDPTLLFIIGTYIPSFYDCNVRRNPHSQIPYFKIAYEREIAAIKDFLQQQKHPEVDINPENWVVVKTFISKEPGSKSNDLKFVLTPKTNIKDGK